MTARDKDQTLRAVAGDMLASYRDLGGVNRTGEMNLPSRGRVVAIIHDLLAVIFPGYHGDPVGRDEDLHDLLDRRLSLLYDHLFDVIRRTLGFCRRKDCLCTTLLDGEDRADGESRLDYVARDLTLKYLAQLAEVRALLDTDVRAAYEGDPAAANNEEIILCYPGVLAIAVHRLAHPLFRLGIPLVPRIMSEWAHSETGADIHPGAVIGPDFFMDHATGVVIGETTEIGAGVKIYQGVTLGALSFPRNPDGTLVKGGKRHPTIEDGVTLYANATILGGRTVIGEGAVVGGGLWITSSVEAGRRVLNPPNAT